MDERIRNRLLEVSESLSIYNATPPSEVDEVFNFNVSEMETISSAKISRFAIVLAQYLITLQVRFNTARVVASQKKKVLDRKVKNLLNATPSIKGKSLAERERNAIDGSEELIELEVEYDVAAAERDLLEGLDKPIIELINALKSELRRRTEERFHTDRERV